MGTIPPRFCLEPLQPGKLCLAVAHSYRELLVWQYLQLDRDKALDEDTHQALGLLNRLIESFAQEPEPEPAGFETLRL